MHEDFNKRHQVTPCSFLQTTSLVSRNADNYRHKVSQKFCSSCKDKPPHLAWPKNNADLYLSLMLEIGRKCLDLKGRFVLEVKIGRASIYEHFWT